MGKTGLEKLKIDIFCPISETEKIPDLKFDRYRDFLTIIKSGTFREKLQQRGCQLTSLEITEFYMRHFSEIASWKLLVRKKTTPEKTINHTEIRDNITENSLLIVLYNLMVPTTGKVYLRMGKYFRTRNKCFFVAVDLDEFLQEVAVEEMVTPEDLEYIRKNHPPDFLEKQIYEERKGWITGKETGNELVEDIMKDYKTKLNLGCSTNHPESIVRLFEFICKARQDETLYNPPEIRYLNFLQ